MVSSPHKLIVLIAASMFAGLLPASADAARGRVQIQNGTVVTDTGEPLRGAHFAWTPTTPWMNNAAWTTLRDDYGLNMVRYGIRITVNKDDPDIMPQSQINAIKADADEAVNFAKVNDMYILIDNHSNCCLKSYRSVVERFWQEFAARYANETHVIYEMQNEPGPSAGYNAEQIALQDVWAQVRADAPDTHIVLWSFPKMNSNLLNQVSQGPPIDYVANNLSVGIHPYGTNFTQAENVQDAGYPIFFTEFALCCGLNNTQLVFEYAESNGVSWAFLDLNPANPSWQGVADPARWPTDLWMNPSDLIVPAAPTDLQVF